MTAPFFSTDLERARALATEDKMGESLDLFRKLCMDATADPAQKYEAVRVLLTVASDAGADIVTRWCDAAPFMEKDAYESHQDLLDKIVGCPVLESHEKLMVVVNQYNQGVLDRCYSNFTRLIKDPSVLLDHRVEACRYLFASTDARYKKVAQEHLLTIINTVEDYGSRWRYKIIANYISKTGLEALTNFAKLPVPYDEEFVHRLQTSFFFNADNGARERILSGQNLLEMKMVGPEEAQKVEAGLLGLAEDPARPDAVRADAADVLIRTASGDAKARAQAIIAALGYSAVRSRDQTVYSDRQNVHTTAISESARAFIRAISADPHYEKIESFSSVYAEVTALVSAADLTPEARAQCFRALDRISIDTATFTETHLGISDVFCYVWHRIKNHPDFRAELETRLLDELGDMADTCSSGHTWRFVNVLSVYDGDLLRISWKEQIQANIIGRLSATIRDIPDETLKDLVALGSMENAEPEEARAFREFADAALADLYSELRKEFVEEGKHLPLDRFDVYFREGSKYYR